MFWNTLTTSLSFTGVKDVTVWQDVVISAFVIPIAIFLGNKILVWWNSIKPSRLLFKGCLKKDNDIYIFHSQMSGADNNYNFNPNQKYITRYPEPLPSNNANLGIQKKLNIDPVLSEAETECLTDVYNILGTVKKVENIKMGDLINDWNVWSCPIISVGFNPKTFKLVEKCDPIHYELLLSSGEIKINNSGISYGSRVPNDAGVVQKTFIKDTDIPVFILAGLGTMGTSSAGYILKENFTEIGKLFSSSPFCIFLKVKINEGRAAAVIDKICPKPKWWRVFLYPLTYYRFTKKNYFKTD